MPSYTPVEYVDLGAFILATLRADAAVTDLVVGGAAGIVGGGELTGEMLNAAEKTRQSSKAAQVLALVVVDEGETGREGKKITTAAVYVYDRQRAYANIRAAREAIITALVNKPVVLARDGFIVQVFYSGRSGFLQFQDFDLDYEWVNFAGPLTYGESSDLYA